MPGGISTPRAGPGPARHATVDPTAAKFDTELAAKLRPIADRLAEVVLAEADRDPGRVTALARLPVLLRVMGKPAADAAAGRALARLELLSGRVTGSPWPPAAVPALAEAVAALEPWTLDDATRLSRFRAAAANLHAAAVTPGSGGGAAALGSALVATPREWHAEAVMACRVFLPGARPAGWDEHAAKLVPLPDWDRPDPRPRPAVLRVAALSPRLVADPTGRIEPGVGLDRLRELLDGLPGDLQPHEAELLAATLIDTLTHSPVRLPGRDGVADALRAIVDRCPRGARADVRLRVTAAVFRQPADDLAGVGPELLKALPWDQQAAVGAACLDPTGPYDPTTGWVEFVQAADTRTLQSLAYHPFCVGDGRVQLQGELRRRGHPVGDPLATPPTADQLRALTSRAGPLPPPLRVPPPWSRPVEGGGSGGTSPGRPSFD